MFVSHGQRREYLVTSYDGRPLIRRRPSIGLSSQLLKQIRGVVGPQIGSDLFGEAFGAVEDAATHDDLQ